jgi:hypothetical protein
MVGFFLMATVMVAVDEMGGNLGDAGLPGLRVEPAMTALCHAGLDPPGFVMPDLMRHP